MSREFWLSRGWYMVWNAALGIGLIALARLVLVQPIIAAIDRLKR